MQQLIEHASDERSAGGRLDYGRLIEDVYECLLEENPVQNLLTLLAEHFGAEMVALVLCTSSDKNNGKILIVSRRSLGDIRYYYNQEIPLNMIRASRFEVALTAAPAESRGAKCEIYNLFLQSVGFYDVDAAEEFVAGDFGAVLKISRGLGVNNFSESERHLVKLIVRHIRQFLSTYNRLENIKLQRNLYADVINKLSFSSFILNRNGKLLLWNNSAKQLLSSEPNIRISDDSLAIGDDALQIHFRQIVDAMLSARDSGECSQVEALRIPRGAGSGGLGVLIRSLAVDRSFDVDDTAAIIVFIRDADYYVEAPVAIVSSLLGLSPTEARIALLLSDGLSLSEVGRFLGMAHATVRTHLRSIFTKVGVNRQALLVRLILKSVAQLA